VKKEQVDLANNIVFIADSKTPTGVAEVPLTGIAAEAFSSQMDLAGPSPWLFPSASNRTGHQTEFKKTWERTLRRAGVPYFRLYDLRSTHATRLSAGGVADEWVTQLLRQTDAKVFKKHSQMKLQMKREDQPSSTAKPTNQADGEPILIRESPSDAVLYVSDTFSRFGTDDGIEGASQIIETARPEVVGTGRFELPTCRLGGDRSIHLSYVPTRSHFT
jgi:Phage integrase family